VVGQAKSLHTLLRQSFKTPDTMHARHLHSRSRSDIPSTVQKHSDDACLLQPIGSRLVKLAPTVLLCRKISIDTEDVDDT
jgi:hypothetical protein